MNAAARLRQRLQWPQPVVVAIDAAAVVLTVAAIWSYRQGIDTDAAFVLSQVLFTAAIPVISIALVLALARIRRMWLDFGMIPLASVLLLGTVFFGWLLCLEAGLGGERCWWERLHL
jgi:predicted permease